MKKSSRKLLKRGGVGEPEPIIIIDDILIQNDIDFAEDATNTFFYDIMHILNNHRIGESGEIEANRGNNIAKITDLLVKLNDSDRLSHKGNFFKDAFYIISNYKPISKKDKDSCTFQDKKFGTKDLFSKYEFK